MTTITVEPTIKERIERQVHEGNFEDASAVLARALDVIENEEKLRVLRALIDEAEESVARGEVFEWTPTTWDEICAEADEEDRLGLPIPDHVKP